MQVEASACVLVPVCPRGSTTAAFLLKGQTLVDSNKQRCIIHFIRHFCVGTELTAWQRMWGEAGEMQTNLRERLSRCRSTAKCVSAGLRALHSNGVKKKKKKDPALICPTGCCWKPHFTCALNTILKQTKNVHYDHSSNFNSEMQKKNHQVSPSERLQYRRLARRWHFGFREETRVRDSKRKETYTFTLMHHSSQVDIHSILNVNIKSVQRQYCVCSII